MDLETFKRSTQKTTTVLVEYIPNADKFEPKITIHKIGTTEHTVLAGMILHELAKKYHDTARQYVFGVPLNETEQMALLNCSEANQLAWFNNQLHHNEVVYAF